MQALLAIIWFIGLLISIGFVFHFIGMNGLTSMFPEGYRRWHPYAQYGSLGLFTLFTHFHPF